MRWIILAERVGAESLKIQIQTAENFKLEHWIRQKFPIQNKNAVKASRETYLFPLVLPANTGFFNTYRLLHNDIYFSKSYLCRRILEKHFKSLEKLFYFMKILRRYQIKWQGFWSYNENIENNYFRNVAEIWKF